MIVMVAEDSCDELTIMLCSKVHVAIPTILIASYVAMSTVMTRRIATKEVQPTIFMVIVIIAINSSKVAIVLVSTQE